MGGGRVEIWMMLGKAWRGLASAGCAPRPSRPIWGDRVATCMVAVVMVTQCALPKADRKFGSIRFQILLDRISSIKSFFFLTSTKL